MYYSMSFCQYYDPSITLPGHQTPDGFSDLTITKNTWDNWHLIPTERPVINPPDLNEHYVTVEGRNGKIDLTQALTGYPTFSNREGSIEFVVMNDYRHWQQAYTDIMTTIHGKKLMMAYEEDPEYFYIGRWTVKKWDSSLGKKGHSNIQFYYDLEPYKWRLQDFSQGWLWDPFNFNSGIITSRIESMTPNSRVIDTTTPGSSDVYLLNYEAYRGPGDASGYPEEQENYSNVIGNAPAVLFVGVHPDVNCSITLKFLNREIYTDNITKTYTESFDGEEPDFVITNYTGVNSIILSATGKGRVSWNFRPGRL